MSDRSGGLNGACTTRNTCSCGSVLDGLVVIDLELLVVLVVHLAFRHVFVLQLATWDSFTTLFGFRWEEAAQS